MPDTRKHQVESINFEYSLEEFAEDWEGVQRYIEQKQTGPNRVVRLVLGAEGQERSLSSVEDDSLSDINQWFLDRYGDDPDYLYARYMRFTILVNVFQDYDKEIRAAGLARQNGYSRDLLKRLLKLKVHPDEHNFAKLDPGGVAAAIEEAKSNPASRGGSRKGRTRPST